MTTYLKNIAIMFRGTLVGQLAPILAIPILSRIYSPEVIGEYAIVFAIAAIIGSIATLKMDLGLVNAKESDRPLILGVLCRLVLPLSLFFVLGVVLLVSIVRPQSPLIHSGPLLMTFLLSLGNAYFNVFNYYNASQEKFKSNSNARAIFALSTVILQIILGLVFDTVTMSLLMGRAIALAISLRVIIRLEKGSLEWSGLMGDFRAALAATRKYVLYYWPASMVDVLGMNLPVLLLGGFFGQANAGFYAYAHRAVSVPAGTISSAISQVFYKKYSDEVRSRSDYTRTLYATWLSLFLIGIIPFSLLTFWGEGIMVFILGEPWRMTGTIVQVISPMAFLIFISTSTSTSLLALGAQREMLFFSIAQILYKLGALYYGYRAENMLLGIIIFVIFHCIQIVTYNATILIKMKRVSV